jgi:hypothetical protein
LYHCLAVKSFFLGKYHVGIVISILTIGREETRERLRIFAQGWYCPFCGRGILQDILENIRRTGGIFDRFAFELTKHSLRYGCLECGATFGEKALKHLIFSI